MKSEKYYFRISPGVLQTDIIDETYSGNTFGVYTGMTDMLSGGTNGSSLFTGLTLPIVFKQTFNDLGYYSTFDGYLLQKDVTNNFIYSGDPLNPFEVTVWNTSDTEYKKFLQLSDYVLDWGDGSSNQNLKTTN